MIYNEKALLLSGNFFFDDDSARLDWEDPPAFEGSSFSLSLSLRKIEV
jgi:hypothetical protein